MRAIFPSIGRCCPVKSLDQRPTIYNPYDYDAVTGLRRPFPGNRIPSSLLDPATQKLLTYTALPNTVIDGVPQYSGLSKSVIDEDQYGLRMDWEKSSNTTIYGRYTFSHRDALSGGLVSPFQGENTPSSTHSAVVHWNQVITPTMINDFSVSYGRLKWGIGRPTDVPDVSKEIGFVNTSNLTGGPGVSVPDFTIGHPGLFVWDPTQNTTHSRTTSLGAEASTTSNSGSTSTSGGCTSSTSRPTRAA